ncbi:tRNA (guanine(10)-N(2))-dimethyltransferase [Archaeoglobus profundus]|uniref:tRNA (guanine(26)-N(2))-dimethyltransferase n=1 Tax=Archaeoglobus profundus (strain DSM 5631 / JCM 9629 / NBRC 100127 / Av18) TaxID=572546 RepID=D2RG63_ARCPA|nr:tRNA (guanine(10)-N(2))-dimethyltransferase [Archaeoglobus profundus]ADB57288.1 N2,N2-dimethylguanosine tRNA methyltransferase [Archaeoglobus profundus DSM 5631]
MIVEEGKVKIKLDRDVFYNPRMRFCRDLDVLVWRVLDDKREFLDALAGTGVRGIRAKVEGGYDVVYFNDRNPKAVELIKENMKLNGIEAEVFNKDANILMREKKFWHIDLDPFGSPAEFMDSASFSVKKYLSVTATDTAAFCGSATESGLRKYFVFAEMTDIYPEIGLRALIGYVARELAKYEKGIEVLVCWTKEHYYRIHLKVRKSLRASKDTVKKLGYMLYCPNCMNRDFVGVGECFERCECGGRFRIYGPIWLGDVKDAEIVRKMLEYAKGKAEKFVKAIAEELNTPLAYNIHALSKKLKINPPKMEKILTDLRENGFTASRVHYSGTVLKTNAKIVDLISLLNS